MSRDGLHADLVAKVAARFAHSVVEGARLPAARLSDLRDSCELSLVGQPPLLTLTCTITGSTYECPWDGAETTALGLADDAAESTMRLVADTRHYAWLQSAR